MSTFDVDLARKALPLMTPAQQAEAMELINSLEAGDVDELDSFKKNAAAAFERDMAPVVNAIVGALKEGDLSALRGLRAVLPHLLREVNADPALAAMLAYQLGKEVIEALKSNE